MLCQKLPASDVRVVDASLEDAVDDASRPRFVDMRCDVLRYLLGGADARLRFWMRLLRACQSRNLKLASKIVANRIQRQFGVFLPTTHPVPASTRFPHPMAIVIGEGVRLGEGVTIYQGVTLGGARKGDWQAGNYPVVESGVTIFAGAVIIGPVTIGRNSTIGANAVVNADVPEGCTAVGIPARVIRRVPPDQQAQGV